MDKSVSYTPPVKFRPLDSEDFGRRAKNLAEFLSTPLLSSQELLARIYGYADLHELRQRLKDKESAGPYNDHLCSFPEVTGENAEHERYKLANASADRRDARLMRIVSEWVLNQGIETAPTKLTLLCDFGLFSSPAAHRAAVKSVGAFLNGASIFTNDGYPFGFKGTLHLRYQFNYPLASGALVEVSKAVQEQHFSRHITDPTAQLSALRQYRAPQLFVKMVTRATPALLTESPELILKADDVFGGNPDEELTRDFCETIASQLIDREDESIREEFTYGEYFQLKEALFSQCPEAAKASPLTRDYLDFRGQVAKWKMSLRLQIAQQMLSGDLSDSYDEDWREEPAYLKVEHENRCLTMLLNPRHAEDGGLQRWEVSGTFLLRDKQTLLWSAVAVLDADYIIPHRDGEHLSANDAIWLFENEASEDLAKAWDILEEEYLLRAGLLSYKKWVNSGAAAANVALWVAPQYRGTEVSKWLLEDFVGAFAQRACSEDNCWREWADVREEAENTDEASLALPRLGVVFLYLPDSRIRGFSLWDKRSGRPKTELVDSRDARLKSTYQRLHTTSTPKGASWSLARRMFDITQSIPTDFVLFDDFADKEPEDD